MQWTIAVVLGLLVLGAVLPAEEPQPASDSTAGRQSADGPAATSTSAPATATATPTATLGERKTDPPPRKPSNATALAALGTRSGAHTSLDRLLSSAATGRG
jgi:hypothetical protein